MWAGKGGRSEFTPLSGQNVEFKPARLVCLTWREFNAKVNRWSLNVAKRGERNLFDINRFVALLDWRQSSVLASIIP